MTEKEKWEQSAEKHLKYIYEENPEEFVRSFKGKCSAFNYEEKWVEISYETQPWQLNDRDTFSGRAMAALFESLLGAVIAVETEDRSRVCVELHVSYVRPLPARENPVGRAYLVQAGKNMARSRAELRSKESGKLIATAAGTFYFL